MLVICVEAIMYLLLYNFHGCTFKRFPDLKDQKEDLQGLESI